MRRWVLAGLLIAGTATAAYLLTPGSIPPATPAEPESPPAGPTIPPSPTVLPAVVDVTPIDFLLDPPTTPPEPTPPSGPVVIAVGNPQPSRQQLMPVSAPPPIPPAVDDDPVPADAENGECGEEDARLEPMDHVAPMPREVKWVAGVSHTVPVLLDGAAVAAILDHDRVCSQSEDTFLALGFFDFTPRPTTASVIKATPLAPLFLLTDAELIHLRTEARQSVWISRPLAPEAGSAAINRLHDVLTIAAPVSRVEWFTRWYGDQPVPRQVGPLLTPEQVRDGVVPTWPFTVRSGSGVPGIGYFF